MSSINIQPLPEWQDCLRGDLRGVLMIIGSPDTGKSTFARFLFEKLCQKGQRVAYLDGDPGQGTLGPPTTMTLVMNKPGDASFPPRGETRRWFIGSVSPRGHMLPMLTGAARLVEAARQAGAEVIVYDTCGLINPSDGGHALKLAKIDLLQPSIVFAIHKTDELETLIQPLRRRRRTQVVTLRPSLQVRQRDPLTRRQSRASRFAEYFTQAHLLEIVWSNLAIIPRPSFSYHQLLAMEDSAGFTLGLGILREVDLQRKRLNLFTPIASLENIDALRLGDLTLDPRTFQEEREGY